MAHRRILSLWFPRLAAQRVLRMRRAALPAPFAITGDRGGAMVLTSLCPLAEAAGLRTGQPLRDAAALCPGLLTHTESPAAEAMFLSTLRRWAGKFSPWVAEESPAALMIDLTGCAHLFGGEAALLAQVQDDCARLGLSVRAGVADTAGAAWALARFAGQDSGAHRNGDAVDQEARATRSRAVKRRGWEKGGAAPAVPDHAIPPGVIAAPGHLHDVLGPLPLAALRLDPGSVEALARLGLRRVADIAGLPRAALARRFGPGVLLRLDQALGLSPEPITPTAADLHFAVRLTLPDPIGLRTDVEAALDRLLPVLCDRLRSRGRGARRIRLQAFRADGGLQVVEVVLARATHATQPIRRLLDLRLDSIDAGFGIDRLRILAPETEPLQAEQHRIGLTDTTRPGTDAALADLLGRLGVRLGPEQVTRLHPAESHLPDRAWQNLAAVWSGPSTEPWPDPPAPRPLVLLTPEALTATNDPMPPGNFRWRRQDMVLRTAAGPERILPEWWFDHPQWRSGPRDYWRIETTNGQKLWLYFAHGAEMSGGWFCHGQFS